MNTNFVQLKDIKELHVEIGYQCNLRCKMCFQKDYTQGMDARIWRKKLLPLYPHLEHLIIQGGEPTVIKETRDLVNLVLAKNPRVKFGTMTNGLLFGDFWQKFFVERGFMVNFSLNGATKKTHEAVNRFSDYDKVIDNLKRLVALRDDSGSGLEIYISFVIIPDNLHEVCDFIKLGKSLGVDRVRFFFDASQLPVDKRVVDEQITVAMSQRRELRESVQVDGLVVFYQYYCFKNKLANKFSQEKEEATERCAVPWRSLYVDHYGKVMSCCLSDVVLGDLGKEDLDDLINNRQAVGFRQRISEGDFSLCHASCLNNLRPVYPLNFSRLMGYWAKFKYDFSRSPSVAIKKGWRKLKQFV